MKLSSSYKEFEANNRAVTLGRIGVIAAAHVLIFGVGYFVTKFGSQLDEGDASMAGANGLVTWSSQSRNADKPTVDVGAGTLFDGRAAQLAGYNAGDGAIQANAGGGRMVAQNSQQRSGRFAPRRPTESRSESSRSESSTSRPSSAPQDDEVLRPLNTPGGNRSQNDARPASGLGDTIEYKVQTGDSLWGISKRFDVSVQEIVRANPGIKANAIRVGQTVNVPRQSQSPTSAPTPAPTVSRATERSTNAGGGNTYVVKAGDSLSSIASRQGVTLRELRAANGIQGEFIRVGQELTIPTSTRSEDLVARQHSGPKVVVEAGDTLDGIAAIHGVSVKELMELNDISDPRRIRINQVLLIPESGRKPLTPEPTRTQQQTAQRTQAQPQPQADAQQRRPTLQSETQPRPTLDELEIREDDQSNRPTLDSLAPDGYQVDDFEEQPLVPIEE